MNTKGYTLVEMLGVIIIITLLSLIIIPAVNTQIKKASNKSEESVVKTIELGAKSWFLDNGSNATCVKVATLINDGYVDNVSGDYGGRCVNISSTGTTKKVYTYVINDKDVTCSNKCS